MTEHQPHHGIGASNPQNAAESVKYTLPIQTVSLGLVPGDESILWQFDPDVNLPVVASADYYGEMCGAYGEPDFRKVRNGTTTVPKTYTAYAHGGGHPEVDFTRDSTLIFFAPETQIANDFHRLYVGTFSDYKRLAGGHTQIIWGESYERPAFSPSQQKHVREVCVSHPGEASFRITRPATEGWVRSEKLLSQPPKSAFSSPPRRIAHND